MCTTYFGEMDQNPNHSIFLCNWFSASQIQNSAMRQKHRISRYGLCFRHFSIPNILHILFLGLKVDVKQLEGLALIDSDTKPPIISLYPESDLPEEIQPRIEELFTVREKWTFDQIKPYVE